jgi:hypothetical protein
MSSDETSYKGAKEEIQGKLAAPKAFGRRTDSLDIILGTGECQPVSPPVLHIFCVLVTFLPLYMSPRTTFQLRKVAPAQF